MTKIELIQRIQELEQAVAEAEIGGELSEQIRTDVLGTLVQCRINLACASEVERVRTRGFAMQRISRKGLM